MIKKSRLRKQSARFVRYYVRLKTHNGTQLFKLLTDSESKQMVDSSPTEISEILIKVVADELTLAVAAQKGLTLEQWLIEPTAIHALVSWEESGPAQISKGSKPRVLTSFIAGFKAATAKRINLVRNQPGSSVWQRSYKEQKVEDAAMLTRLRKRLSELEEIVLTS